MASYLDMLGQFRFKVESEIKNKIKNGEVWDKTSVMMNEPEDPEAFDELPEMSYEEDGFVDYYKLVLSDSDFTFKGLRNDESRMDYYWTLEEMPINVLCQILDTWDS